MSIRVESLVNLKGEAIKKGSLPGINEDCYVVNNYATNEVWFQYGDDIIIKAKYDKKYRDVFLTMNKRYIYNSIYKPHFTIAVGLVGLWLHNYVDNNEDLIWDFIQEKKEFYTVAHDKIVHIDYTTNIEV